MFDKLDFITEKYDELSRKVSDPDVINNQPEWQKYIKEMGEMEPIVKKYTEYKKAKQDLAEAKEMLEDGDEEMRELAKMEIGDLEETIANAEDELKVLLLPKDPNDEKNVILEIRAGTGGEEAALFGADLLRMYTRYAERNRWKTELMDMSETGMGGVKEAVMLIKGKGAYSRLKFESGAHRVQRVPETESSGRVHTSAATVAVLPEVDDVEVDLDPNDVRVDVYRASGNGTDWPRGYMPGREVSDQEQGQGVQGSQGKTLRPRDAETAGGDRRSEKEPGWFGRQKRENQNIQLPAGQSFRPQNRTYPLQAGYIPRRRSR